MYRSGSTVAYQIIKAIARLNGDPAEDVGSIDEERVKSSKIYLCKFHDVPKERFPGVEHYYKDINYIYTYRDIRDVVVSMCQVEMVSPANFPILGHDIPQFINKVLDLDDYWNKLEVSKIVAQYELFYDKLEVLIEQIYKFMYGIGIKSGLRLELNINQIDKMKKDLAIEKQKLFAASLSEEHKDSKLRIGHVHDGQIGKWQRFFSQKEKEEYFSNNPRLSQWFAKYGY